MPRKPNTFLRVAVPIALLASGAVLAIAIATNPPGSQNKAAPPPNASAPQDAQAPVGADASPTTGEPSRPATDDGAETPDASTADATPIQGLRARPVASGQALRPLGSLDDADPTEIYIEFTPLGAGIESLKLTHDYQTVERKEHVELQRTALSRPNAEGRQASLVPFALVKVEINGTEVFLTGFPDPIWRQDETDPGLFTAEIEDADGRLVARIVRHFRLERDSFNLEIDQRLENLTDQPMTVVWTQTGPIDLAPPRSTYGGDKRRVRYGYVLPPEKQGAASDVTADTKLTARTSTFGPRDKSSGRYDLGREIWPNTWSQRDDNRLVWVAMTDRYFAVAAHPRLDPDNLPQTADAKRFDMAQSVKRLMVNTGANAKDKEYPSTIVLQLTSEPQTIAPNAAADGSIALFAGPMDPKTLEADPVTTSLGIDGIVIYNFGSICAFCTFSWLTHVLLFILRALHMLTHDWALAIILLVVVVRTCLHPVTRWSQIRMQRFGAQMQAMGPKQKKIKEKYADDPKKQQQEMAKLWKEEGISPAGMLGCLPMFLQSPVWIALYATLFFVYDLRHQPAFYGVFQKISGGNWHFLADLASPDAAIPLPGGMHFSFWIWGTVTSINILPFILAAVFFVHQKYLTPPTSVSLTPEQESQQKIMRVMMVVMFPLFMYAAPSGLALYFVTNSGLAIVENKWIRAHMNKHDLLNVEKIKAQKAEKRRSGFMARLMEMAEKQQAARSGKPEGFGTGRSARNMYRQPSKPEPTKRQYKKRK